MPSGLSSHQQSPQCGPSAGIPFTCSPVVVESRLEPQIFRVLLLRRFWCPFPLSAHSCPCGRPLDVRGHHRAACGRAGVLGLRGCRWKAQRPVSAVRQVGVSINVRVADPPPGRIDDRKIEVIQSLSYFFTFSVPLHVAVFLFFGTWNAGPRTASRQEHHSSQTRGYATW